MYQRVNVTYLVVIRPDFSHQVTPYPLQPVHSLFPLPQIVMNPNLSVEDPKQVGKSTRWIFSDHGIDLPFKSFIFTLRTESRREKENSYSKGAYRPERETRGVSDKDGRTSS